MSLTQLIEKMKELAGLKPLLKKVWNKHFEIEMDIDHIRRRSEDFMTDLNLNVQWGIFTKEMRDLVKELHQEQDTKFDDKIKILAVESEVQKRLDAKCTKYDYGAIMLQFLDIKNSLQPLIEKKETLDKFISQVNKHEINEINAKDFN